MAGLFIALQVGTKGECAFLKPWGVTQVRNRIQQHRSPPFLGSHPVYNYQGWLAAMRISHRRLKDPPHQQLLFTYKLTEGFLEPLEFLASLLPYPHQTSTFLLKHKYSHPWGTIPIIQPFKILFLHYSLHILGQMPPCTSSTPQIPVTNKIKPFQVSLPLLPFLWSF